MPQSQPRRSGLPAADAAVDTITAQAGAVVPETYAARLQGLIAVRARRHLPARRTRTGPSRAQWWPPTKIAGRELDGHVVDPPRPAVPEQSDGATDHRSA